MKNEELKEKKHIYCLNGLTYILVTIFLFLAIAHFICTDKYEIHGYFVISILFVLNILAMIFDYLKFRTVQKKEYNYNVIDQMLSEMKNIQDIDEKALNLENKNSQKKFDDEIDEKEKQVVVTKGKNKLEVLKNILYKEI